MSAIWEEDRQLWLIRMHSAGLRAAVFFSSVPSFHRAGGAEMQRWS
ncbi:Uncharacterised protein [Chlamydia abortus]|nr:Uncharacterised protein [Chlamydia abortus]